MGMCGQHAEHGLAQFRAICKLTSCFIWVHGRTAAMLGEYRNIMNLCRVLPGGTEAKLAVDEAIDACFPIGNFREDIFRYGQTSSVTSSCGHDFE